MQSFFKIGSRTLKTAFAVFLCLVLFPKVPFFACMTAVFCLQNTVNHSFRIAFVRGFGTIWGGIIGLVFIYIRRFVELLPLPSIIMTYTLYATVALGVIVMIQSLNLFKRPDCINIGCIVFLAITTVNADKMPMFYMVNRVVETLFGIVVGLLVNRFINPPPREHVEVE